MKKFFNTRITDMTVAQSFLYVLLYMIIMLVAMPAMILVPQHSEEIWDWIEDKFESAVEWVKNLFKKESFEKEMFN